MNWVGLTEFFWVQSGIPRHALWSNRNRRVCGRRDTPLEKEGTFVGLWLDWYDVGCVGFDYVWPSLTASLLSPDQCEARSYCKVKQCEAAVKEKPGMNIYADAVWLRTRICRKPNPMPTHLFKVFAKLFSKSVPPSFVYDELEELTSQLRSLLPNDLDY